MSSIHSVLPTNDAVSRLAVTGTPVSPDGPLDAGTDDMIIILMRVTGVL